MVDPHASRSDDRAMLRALLRRRDGDVVDLEQLLRDTAHDPLLEELRNERTTVVAIASEVRASRDLWVAEPRRRRSIARPVTRVAVAAATVVITAGSSLAVTGGLPDPARALASDWLALIVPPRARVAASAPPTPRSSERPFAARGEGSTLTSVEEDAIADRIDLSNDRVRSGNGGVTGSDAAGEHVGAGDGGKGDPVEEDGEEPGQGGDGAIAGDVQEGKGSGGTQDGGAGEQGDQGVDEGVGGSDAGGGDLEGGGDGGSNVGGDDQGSQHGEGNSGDANGNGNGGGNGNGKGKGDDNGQGGNGNGGGNGKGKGNGNGGGNGIGGNGNEGDADVGGDGGAGDGGGDQGSDTGTDDGAGEEEGSTDGGSEGSGDDQAGEEPPASDESEETPAG